MSILNNIQARRYNEAQTLARFFHQNKRIYTLSTPFTNEVNSFLHLLGQLPAQAAVKEKKGTGITRQKKELKKAIARDGAVLCTTVTAYTITTGDKALNEYNLGRFTYTNLYTLKDGEVLAAATIIRNAITPLLTKAEFIPYGITADDLTSLLEKARRYNDSLGSAAYLNIKSRLASQNITATLKKIKACITQMNRLVSFFSKKHPGFVAGFREACATSSSGRHNAVEGVIKDSCTGQPVEGVTITGEGKNKTAVTNASGCYRLARIKTGSYQLTITAAGYAAQVVRVQILRGKAIHLPVHLKSTLGHVAESAVA